MLTKQQIQFIDKYLEDKGVYYIDIRHELTDHIATELEQKEGDFGQNFLAYRIVNQENLLKQSVKLHIASIYKAASYLFRVMCKPQNAIIIISTFLLCNYILATYASSTIAYLSYASGLASLPFSLLYKYTSKSAIPRNILYGLLILFLILPFTICMAGLFMIDNMPITIIIARYTFSFLIAVMPVALLSVIKYKSHNYKLN